LFGSIEFFITIDGYIKNSIKIPIELLEKINENTYHSFYQVANALKYVENNKIRLIKIKSREVSGLKPCDYDDFSRINYPGDKKKYEDWIEYNKKRGFLDKFS